MSGFGRVETYIGDGIYASFDGYQIWLRTPREGGWHAIALEPGMFRTRRDALVFVGWLLLAYLVPLAALWAVTR